MTEKALAEIVDEARNRWPLGRVTVIHRIGELWPAMKLFLSVLPVRIAAVRLKRAVYYGLSQNPRTVLEARSHAGRRPLGRSSGERSAGGKTLVVYC